MVEHGSIQHHTWDEIPAEQVTDSLSRRMITGSQLMLAQVFLKKGCVVPMHSHLNEQLTSVVQGELRFLIGSETSESVVVGPGQVLVVPANVPHQVEAATDSVVIDAFSPPRQDWLDRTDDYLRR